MPEMTYPHVLAQRPDGALLVALNAKTGCIYHPARKIVYPQFGLVSLLARPYWQAYSGSQDVLRDWPGPLPLPSFPRPNPTPDDAA